MSENSLRSGPDLQAGDDPVSLLIVDDEAGNRQTLADVFTESGYSVVTAATGQEGMEKARDRFFNVAILDIKLPDMYGTELLVRLKEAHPDTTCIMVTGYASLQTSMKAINAGAYAYILKPLDIEHLCHVLRQAVEKQRDVFEGRRQMRQLVEQVARLEKENAALRRS
jgi:DNA-binding NtrC family response regulator